MAETKSADAPAAAGAAPAAAGAAPSLTGSGGVREEDMRRLQLYVPPLTTGLFFWALKCVCSMFFGSIVVNVYDTYCNYPLGTFLVGQVALSYIFILTWGWIFIGPIPFKSITPICVLYGVYGVFQLVWGIVGTAWYSMGALACREMVPETTSMAQFEVATFWMSFTVGVLYLGRWRYELYAAKKLAGGGKKKKKKKEKANKADKYAVGDEDDGDEGGGAGQETVLAEDDEDDEDDRARGDGDGRGGAAKKDHGGESESDEDSDGDPF